MSLFDLFSFDLLQEFFLYIRPMEKIFELDAILHFRGQRNQIILIDDKFKNSYSLCNYQIPYKQKIIIDHLIGICFNEISIDHFIRLDINDNSLPNRDKFNKESKIVLESMIENFHKLFFSFGNTKKRIDEIIIEVTNLNLITNPSILKGTFCIYLWNKIITNKSWTFKNGEFILIILFLVEKIFLYYNIDFFNKK